MKLSPSRKCAWANFVCFHCFAMTMTIVTCLQTACTVMSDTTICSIGPTPDAVVETYLRICVRCLLSVRVEVVLPSTTHGLIIYYLGFLWGNTND